MTVRRKRSKLSEGAMLVIHGVDKMSQGLEEALHRSANRFVQRGLERTLSLLDVAIEQASKVREEIKVHTNKGKNDTPPPT